LDEFLTLKGRANVGAAALLPILATGRREMALMAGCDAVARPQDILAAAK
jgi:hypothetical protein